MKIIRVSFVLFFVLTLCVPNSTSTHQSAGDRTGKIVTKIVVGTIATTQAILNVANATPPDIRVISFGVGLTFLMSAGYDLIKLCLPRPMNDNHMAFIFRD